MVKKNSLLLCIILILAAFAISGCKSNSKEGKNAESNIDYENLLEFEFYRNYSWDVGKYPFDETNKISRWIMENKGVKVNFTWPGGNANDRLNIMVASDALPEVIMISRDSTWLNLISEDGLSDQILSLDEFYEKYEGYRGNVSQEMVDFTRVNGKIYGMLNWPKDGDWLGYGTGLIINNEMYKELGSPDISTLDGLYNYLKMVKEADPSIVPLQPGSGEITFGLLWCSYGGGRVPEDMYGITREPVDGKLLHVINDPKLPDFLKYLRKLYSEGLISQEYAIEMSEPIMDKMKKRKVAVFSSFDGVSTADSARSILEAAGKENPYIAVPLPVAPGVNPSEVVSGQASKVGWNIICLTKNAGKVNGKEVEGRAEAIYAYLDWVFSDEGQRVMLCGPEGELWEGVDENGFPIFKEGKSLKLSEEALKELPIGQFMYPGNAAYVDALKNHIAQQSNSELEWSVEQQLKFANNLRDTTEFTGLETITDQEISQIYVRADDYWQTKLVELVVGTEDIDSMLETIKKDLYGSYSFQVYEEYATNVWKENRIKMGLSD